MQNPHIIKNLYQYIQKKKNNLLKVTNKKTDNVINTFPEDLNRHITKEDTQIGKKHVNKSSTLFVIMEMQNNNEFPLYT